VKYRIRRRIRELGAPFQLGREVFDFARNDPALTLVGLSGAGISSAANSGDGKAAGIFTISRRRFFHYPESEICSKWCTSPLFFTSGTKGEGELKTKFDIFCLRPALNPPVRVMDSLPVPLGLPVKEGGQSVVEPYKPETLNYVGSDGFGGHWRRLSCCCPACLFPDGAGLILALLSFPTDCVAYADTSCTFYGAAAPAWIPYRATRKPEGVGRSRGFLEQFGDGLLAGGFSGAFEERLKQIGWFINKVLHRFNGVKKATSWISARASGSTWVESCVCRELARFKGQKLEFWTSPAFAQVEAHLEKVDWFGSGTIPSGVKGKAKTADWKRKQRSNFLDKLKAKSS
jgi:hypothetical protein